ncbi:MAG: hypothetical protein WCK37_01305 [Candidatus Falkowbacteria bacterium]
MEKITFIAEFVKTNSFSFIVLMSLSVVIMLVSNLIFFRKKAKLLALFVAIISVLVASIALVAFYKSIDVAILGATFPSVVLGFVAIAIVFSMLTFFAIIKRLEEREYFCGNILYYGVALLSSFALLY